MSDCNYIMFWLLVGVSAGMVLNLLMEYFVDKPKKKVKTVQPQIESYGKNYKKISKVGKFNKVG